MWESQVRMPVPDIRIGQRPFHPRRTEALCQVPVLQDILSIIEVDELVVSDLRVCRERQKYEDQGRSGASASFIRS